MKLIRFYVTPVYVFVLPVSFLNIATKPEEYISHVPWVAEKKVIRSLSFMKFGKSPFKLKFKKIRHRKAK